MLENTTGPARMVALHAGTYWHGAIRDGRIDFFDRPCERRIGEGVATRLVPLGGSASDVLLGQDNANIIGGGQRA